MITLFFRPAAIVGTLPNILANGQTADAVPLMADLNHLVNQINANAAELSLTPQLANANTFTAVQSGVSATAAANFPIASQLQNASLTTLSSIVGNNTITARVSGFTLGAYTRGQVFSFVPAAGNSGSATINIDAVGATTIYKGGARTLSSNDLVLGNTTFIRYRTPVDGLATGFDLMNPGFTIQGPPVIGDLLVGAGNNLYSTLTVGSNLQLPFASTSAATRISWMGVNQLPLASSMDSTRDFVLINSLSIGTNARATPNILGAASSGYRLINFTRDLTAASANVSYTGVGFRPKAVIIVGVDSGHLSVGASDGAANHALIAEDGASNAWVLSTLFCAAITQTVSDNQTASVLSMDPDGFTLAWTKNGAPTTTATFFALAFK